MLWRSPPRKSSKCPYRASRPPRSSSLTPFPDGASLDTISSSTVSGTRNIDLNMQASVATSGGMLLKVVFSNGVILAGALNGASVPNYGIASGQAKLIDPGTGVVLGTGAISVSGSTIHLSVADALLSGAQPTMAVSNYTDAIYLNLIGVEALEMFPGSAVHVGPTPTKFALPGIITTTKKKADQI